MPTIDCPLPLDTCLVRIEAQHGRARGFWRTDVIHKPKASFSRIGIRQVPTRGIPYHLVLLRADLQAVTPDVTRVTARQKVNEWVWFATVPLAGLVMYSVGLWVQGDLVVNAYTLGVLGLLVFYIGFIAALVVDHARHNRAVLQSLIQPPPAPR